MKIVIHRYEVILVGSLLLLSGAVIPSSWEPAIKTLPKPVVGPPVIEQVAMVAEVTPPLTQTVTLIPIVPPPVVPAKLVKIPPVAAKTLPMPVKVVHAPAATHHARIALTFDDGPHPIMTQRLLQVLQNEHVPGTFFVVGKMADRYPQILQEMASDGNEIANHTYSHPRLPSLSNDEIVAELAETRAVIQRLTGKDSLIYRPPGGDYSKRMVRATARAGYHMILWSVLTKDVQGASEHAIHDRIVDGAQDGGIILMHSGIQNTISALPKAIEDLRAKGYEFVTVSQLLKHPTSHKPAMKTEPSEPVGAPNPSHDSEYSAGLSAPNRPHLE